MSCSSNSCPSRRAFLQDVGAAALGALVLAGLHPDRAIAQNIGTIVGGSPRRGERSYPVPTSDGVAFDEVAGVILVRADGRAFAFSTECPHRGAQLEFLTDEKRIWCHKHDARFANDGQWLSGRRTRALDRYPIRLENGQLIVTTDRALEQDADADEYLLAQVTLP